MNHDQPGADAHQDWQQRIGARSGTATVGQVPVPAPPTALAAVAGRHQVTLTWDPVPGAVGYQVHATDDPEGPLTPLDHLGGDVLAVPHPPYVDTTGTPGVERRYAVAALADVDVEGAPSAVVAATPDVDGDGHVTVQVDAAGDAGPLDRPWREMIGSEHLSFAVSDEQIAGHTIGEQLTTALREAHDRLGVRTVRAHGILCDDLAVYREVDGRPVHDFSGVDRVYGHVVSLGLRPCVELSFMPRDLASDPDATVFEYGAIVSPPRDWARWGDLVRDLVAHLVDRHGLAEVRDHWTFEVWNEANLEVFWSGTPEEYWRLYDVTVTAVRDVHPDLVVAGPATAAAGWVEAFLAHTDHSGAPVDALTTHTYGSPPLDFRPALARHGRADTPIWWTEWGVTPTHFHEVNDSVFAGAFLLRGMASAMGRIEALSYWVVSDHFEELGRPPSLLHGGFGLQTVGGLHKPRWWALQMLEDLGQRRLGTRIDGDGGGSLVEAIGTRAEDGTVAVLAWNLTLDQGKRHGDDALARQVTLEVSGLAPGSLHRITQRGVEPGRSDVAAAWQRLRRPGQDWPDADQWDALRASDQLEQLASPATVAADADGRVEVSFALPMPAMRLVEVAPTRDDRPGLVTEGDA